jgi:hypothetical protein
MKNVTLDDTTILQLDADGTDSTLDAAGDRHVMGTTPQRAVEADGSRTTASCIQVASRAELGRLIDGGLNNVAVCDQPMCATRS